MTMPDRFTAQIIQQLAEQVTARTPQYVRFAWDRKRCNGQGYLHTEGDTLCLKGTVSGWLRTRDVDVRVARADIAAWERTAAGGLALRIGTSDGLGLLALRGVEFNQGESADRLVAWLPPQPAAPNFVRRWYHWNLGDYRREAYASYALIAVLALCYLAQVIDQRSWSFSAEALLAQGANYPPMTLDDEPWRLLAAVFLHASAAHFLGNALVVLLLAPYLERLYGRTGLLSVFLGAGLMGSVVDLGTNFSVIAVGASGGVFGVLGALLAYPMRRRNHLPLSSIRAILIIGGGYVLWELRQGLASEVVNNSAHVSGLVTGWVLGFCTAPPFARTGRSKYWLLAPWVSLLMTLSVAAAAWVWHQRYSTDLALVRWMEQGAQALDSRFTRCQPDSLGAHRGRYADRAAYEQDCLQPLLDSLRHLQTAPIRDALLQAQVRRQSERLQRAYEQNLRLVVLFEDVARIQPAEQERKRALDACADALLEGKSTSDAQRLQSMADCIAGMRVAVRRLEGLSPKTETLQEYVALAKTLWYAELEALVAMQSAIRRHDVRAFDRAAEALRAARQAYRQRSQARPEPAAGGDAN